MQRSLFKYLCYNENAAVEDLEKGLILMEEKEYDHFWSWEPLSFLPLLTLAVKNSIRPSFCRMLAKKRIGVTIADNGRVIPLIHFTILDSFTITMAVGTTISVEQLTPLQRELLSLLLLNKDRKINQEKVQLILWPESSPEKSRKKFDTLLGRLRNTFSDNFPIDVMDYIVLNKGILSLENSTSDIEDFSENCKAAFKHSSRNEFWQAGNRFNSALALWKGKMPSDYFRNDTVFSYEDTLLTTYEKASLQWAKILGDFDRPREAIPILSKMLKTYPLSENGVLQLCILYSHTMQPLKIRKTLERYKKALEAEDYEEEEIRAMIDEITVALIETS
jgi:DNA-binding SARP family transcriptional activator